MKKFSKWTKLKLLNGWKPIPGFRPPEFKVSESGGIDIRGNAQPPLQLSIISEQMPFAILPEELDVIREEVSTIGFVGGEYYIQKWSVDEEGYLYWQRLEKVLRVFDECGNPYFISKKDFDE